MIFFLIRNTLNDNTNELWMWKKNVEKISFHKYNAKTMKNP